MNSYKALLGMLLLACLFVPKLAAAAESYDNCTGYIDSLPAGISTQGTWCLRKDLATNISSGAAIVVETNNVTIDCNGFKVGGQGAGTGTMAMGITSQSGKNNTTIRNCRVRGFWLGVHTEGGSGQLIEDNEFDGNTTVGIDVYSAKSTVRHNTVRNTGGSTASANGAQGIVVSGGVDVIDNTVSGVVANHLQPNNDARGIVAVDNAQGSVVGNRVRDIVPFSPGASFGIIDFTQGFSVIRDNIVQGTDLIGSIGIKCNLPGTTSQNNLIVGFATSVQSCTSVGDTSNN